MQGTAFASPWRLAGSVLRIFGRVSPRSVLLAGLLTFATGCATAPDRDAVPTFRASAATANQRSQTAFAEINTFLRQQQIERATRLPNISEQKDESGVGAFFTPLASEDVAKWSRAFGLIDAYAATLEKLLAPARRADTESALSELGEKIGDVREERLPPGIAAGFTQLAGLLVQMKAEKDALAAIRKADPAVQDVFSAMMAAIGENPSDGVRGTVVSSWTTVLGQIQVDFLNAQGIPAKREVATRYVAALDQRDAQDASLASLRRSFGLLAAAHRELAVGRAPSAQRLLDAIQQEYEAYRNRVESLQNAKGAAP
jgi:hypothetical protein